MTKIQKTIKIRCKQYLIVAFVLFIALFFPLNYRAKAVEDSPNILVLNSYHQGEDWSDNEIKGIRTKLNESYPFLVPSIEDLDTKRFSTTEHLLTETQYLKNKYRGKDFDLIITLDNSALDLMLNFGDDLFPSVPIVFAGVNGYSADMLQGHRGITGVAEVEDVQGTFNLALRINPGIKTVFAVHDYTSSGIAVHRDMKAVEEKFKEKVRIKYSPDGTIDDLVSKLRELDRDAIVIILTYVTDKNGRTFTREESTRIITSASPVPVYAMHETRLNYGIVGGMLLKGEEHGKQAAEMALKIISGENPDTIEVVNSRSFPVFDYNQLVRFKIPIKLLPTNSAIINQPLSFWDQHQTVLLPGLIILGFFTVTICILSISIIRIRKAEESVRETVERLNLATRVASLGIWDWNINKNELIWDDGMYLLYGIKNDEFTNVYEAWLNGLHPEDRIENDKLSEQARRGEREYDTEFRVVWPDGTIRYLKALGQVIWDSDGNPIRMIGINYDITEKKEMEARIQQSQKMEAIGSLAGGIAHDFNNILFPIVGLSEMMLDDFPPGSLVQQNLNEIFQAGKRGRELVQQILSFSRQSEHQPIPVHIQKILKEVLKLCRATIPADITITKDIQADCGPVMADPTRIHQIVMNLITNAYHAVEPAGGIISIQLTEVDVISMDDPANDLLPGRYALLSVSDTGIGIDKAVIDKIFEPYFTTKEKGRGTGLGLATVYGIVKAHGGDIRVKSDMSKGAAFHVYLPLMEKAQDSEPKKQQQPLPTGTEHILLVDDEKPIVQLEKQMLERLGYQTSSFTSSRDALDAFKTESSTFDLVITDMNMANMNGIQLAVELIAVRADIPIILCTGFSERISSNKAEALGIRGLLMKPMGMKDLAQKIREVLDTTKKES